MLEALAASILSKVLGKYVLGLQDEQIRLSVLSGNLTLENLQLRPEAIESLGYPMRMVFGYLGKLQLKLPWHSLNKDPVILKLERIFILLKAKGIKEYDPVIEASYEKQKRLEIDSNLQIFSQETAKSKDETFLMQLVTKIVSNLQIEISSISIRYEDDLSNPERPFAVGVTLTGLSAITTNSKWEPTFFSESQPITYKRALLQKLSVYYERNPPFISNIKDTANIASLMEKWITQRDSSKSQLILEPVSGFVNLFINRFDPSLPQGSLEIFLESIKLALTDEQYKMAFSLRDFVESYIRYAKYFKFRPKELKGSKSQLRWTLVRNAVLHELRKKKFRPTYRSLWWKKSRNKKLTQQEEKMLVELENELSVDDIRFLRSMAEIQLKITAEHESSQQKKGFFSSFTSWMSGNQGSNAPQQKQTTEAIKLTPEDWAKIEALIDFDPSNKHLSGNKKYKLLANLQKASIQLNTVSSTNVTPLARMDLLQINFSLSLLESSLVCEANLSQLKVIDPDKATSFQFVVDSETTSGSKDLLSWKLETQSGGYDYLTSLVINPVQIVYNPVFFYKVFEFFDTKSASWEDISEAAEDGSDNWKKMISALELQKSMGVSATYRSPTILIPESCYTTNSPLLVLDLGNLTFSNMNKQKKAQTEEDKLYNKIDLRLESINLSLFDSLVSFWGSNLQLRSKSEIVEKFNLLLDLSISRIHSRSLTAYKVNSSLPSIRLNLSIELCHLLNRIVKSAIQTISQNRDGNEIEPKKQPKSAVQVRPKAEVPIMEMTFSLNEMVVSFSQTSTTSECDLFQIIFRNWSLNLAQTTSSANAKLQLNHIEILDCTPKSSNVDLQYRRILFSSTLDQAGAQDKPFSISGTSKLEGSSSKLSVDVFFPDVALVFNHETARTYLHAFKDLFGAVLSTTKTLPSTAPSQKTSVPSRSKVTLILQGKSARLYLVKDSKLNSSLEVRGFGATLKSENSWKLSGKVEDIALNSFQYKNGSKFEIIRFDKDRNVSFALGHELLEAENTSVLNVDLLIENVNLILLFGYWYGLYDFFSTFVTSKPNPTQLQTSAQRIALTLQLPNSCALLPQSSTSEILTVLSWKNLELKKSLDDKFSVLAKSLKAVQGENTLIGETSLEAIFFESIGAPGSLNQQNIQVTVQDLKLSLKNETFENLIQTASENFCEIPGLFLNEEPYKGPLASKRIIKVGFQELLVDLQSESGALFEGKGQGFNLILEQFTDESFLLSLDLHSPIVKDGRLSHLLVSSQATKKPCSLRLNLRSETDIQKASIIVENPYINFFSRNLAELYGFIFPKWKKIMSTQDHIMKHHFGKSNSSSQTTFDIQATDPLLFLPENFTDPLPEESVFWCLCTPTLAVTYSEAFKLEEIDLKISAKNVQLIRQLEASVRSSTAPIVANLNYVEARYLENRKQQTADVRVQQPAFDMPLSENLRLLDTILLNYNFFFGQEGPLKKRQEIAKISLTDLSFLLPFKAPEKPTVRIVANGDITISDWSTAMKMEITPQLQIAYKTTAQWVSIVDGTFSISTLGKDASNLVANIRSEAPLTFIGTSEQIGLLLQLAEEFPKSEPEKGESNVFLSLPSMNWILGETGLWTLSLQASQISFTKQGISWECQGLSVDEDGTLAFNHPEIFKLRFNPESSGSGGIVEVSFKTLGGNFTEQRIRGLKSFYSTLTRQMETYSSPSDLNPMWRVSLAGEQIQASFMPDPNQRLEVTLEHPIFQVISQDPNFNVSGSISKFLAFYFPSSKTRYLVADVTLNEEFLTMDKQKTTTKLSLTFPNVSVTFWAPFWYEAYCLLDLLLQTEENTNADDTEFNLQLNWSNGSVLIPEEQDSGKFIGGWKNFTLFSKTDRSNTLQIVVDSLEIEGSRKSQEKFRVIEKTHLTINYRNAVKFSQDTAQQETSITVPQLKLFTSDWLISLLNSIVEKNLCKAAVRSEKLEFKQNFLKNKFNLKILEAQIHLAEIPTHPLFSATAKPFSLQFLGFSNGTSKIEMDIPSIEAFDSQTPLVSDPLEITMQLDSRPEAQELFLHVSNPKFLVSIPSYFSLWEFLSSKPAQLTLIWNRFSTHYFGPSPTASALYEIVLANSAFLVQGGEENLHLQVNSMKIDITEQSKLLLQGLTVKRDARTLATVRRIFISDLQTTDVALQGFGTVKNLITRLSMSDIQFLQDIVQKQVAKLPTSQSTSVSNRSECLNVEFKGINSVELLTDQHLPHIRCSLLGLSSSFVNWSKRPIIMANLRAKLEFVDPSSHLWEPFSNDWNLLLNGEQNEGGNWNVKIESSQNIQLIVSQPLLNVLAINPPSPRKGQIKSWDEDILWNNTEFILWCYPDCDLSLPPLQFPPQAQIPLSQIETEDDNYNSKIFVQFDTTDAPIFEVYLHKNQSFALQQFKGKSVLKPNFVCEVSCDHGRRILQIRHPITICNSTKLSFEVLLDGKVVPLDPKSKISIPRSSDELRFRPKDLMYQFTTNALYLSNMTSSSSPTLFVCPAPESDFPAFFFTTSCQENQSLAGDHQITIKPLIKLKNCLSTSLTTVIFLNGREVQRQELTQGESAVFHSLTGVRSLGSDFEKSLQISMTIPYFKESKPINLPTEKETSFVLYEKGADRGLRLYMTMKAKNGCRIISIYSLVWLANHTSLPLLFGRREEDDITILAGQTEKYAQDIPLMTGVDSLAICLHNKSYWSRKNIWLNSNHTIQYEEIEHKDSHKKVEVAIEVQFIHNQKFPTKVVNFMPRYMIMNRTEIALLFTQPNGSDVNTLNPGDLSTIWWNPGLDKSICISFVTPQPTWSGEFKLSRSEEFLLLVPLQNSNTDRFLKISIRSVRGTTLVSISPNPGGNPSLLISNESSKMADLWQSDWSEQKWRLKPNESHTFGWIKPNAPHALTLHMEAKPPVALPVEQIGSSYNSNLGLNLQTSFVHSALTRKFRFSDKSLNQKFLLGDQKSLKVSLDIAQFSISIVSWNERLEPLFEVTGNKLLVQSEIRQNSSFSASLQSLVIRNSNQNTPCPDVFTPTNPSKQFLSLTLTKSGTEEVAINRFFQVFIEIQPFDFKLDSSSLLNGLSFVDNLQSYVGYKQNDPNAFEREIRDNAPFPTFYYFDKFFLSKLVIRLTFKSISELSDPLKKKIRAVTGFDAKMLPQFTNSPVIFSEMDAFHTMRILPEFVSMLAEIYKKQCMSQVPSIVGSLDFLGAPLQLASKIGEGFDDFVRQINTDNPVTFVEGLAKGTASLLGSTVEGFSGSASLIADRVASGASKLTLDREYQKNREQKLAEREPHDFGEGLKRGAKDFAGGIVDGLKGIIEEPIKGTKQGGFAGLVGGLGRGLIGVAAKPIVGFNDFARNTAKGIQSGLSTPNENETRNQPKRKFSTSSHRLTEFYYIVSATDPNLVLEIENGHPSPGAKLVTAQFHGGPHQKFCFEPDGHVWVEHSGLVLDVSGSIGENRKIIQWEPSSGAPNQLWAVDNFYLRVRNHDLLLTISQKTRSPGIELIVARNMNANEQKWKFIKA